MNGPFAEAWKRTGRSEGSYSNNPDDPGGETMWGVTSFVARKQGYTGPMKDLSREMAEKIARDEYWAPLRLDDIAAISADVAFELFDTNFNLYHGAAASFLQLSLSSLNRQQRDYPDINLDGRIGLKTIEALKAFIKLRGREGEVVLLRCLNSLQCADYIRQAAANPRKESFLYGWVLQRVKIEDA